MEGDLKIARNTLFVLLIVTALVFIIYLVKSLFGISDDNPEKVIVAMIGLVGIALTSSVTILGLIFKKSIDEKNIRLQLESEKRFRMDTALRAIELMHPEIEDVANLQEKREGALITISTLKEHVLSMNLLSSLWEQGKVSRGVAIHIIDQGLCANDRLVQINAASLLNDNSDKLTDGDGNFSFPDSVYLKWNNNLAARAKDSVFTALIKCMLSQDKEYWKNHSLNQFLYCMYKIMEDGSHSRVQGGAALCTQKLINIVAEGKLESGFCPPDRNSIHYKELLEKANKILPDVYDESKFITQKTFNLSIDIKKWGNQELDFFETIHYQEPEGDSNK